MKQEQLRRTYFIEGPVSPEAIAGSIRSHSAKTHVGAHDIFLGQVRADIIDKRTVEAIEYSCYPEMANKVIGLIREDVIVKYKLSCAHVTHSMGYVPAGGISLFVFVSSPHRAAAMSACREMVERIKNEVPVFGKEIFTDRSHAWKENKNHE